jgi:hypothetical protein
MTHLPNKPLQETWDNLAARSDVHDDVLDDETNWVEDAEGNIGPSYTGLNAPTFPEQGVEFQQGDSDKTPHPARIIADGLRAARPVSKRTNPDAHQGDLKKFNDHRDIVQGVR